MNKTLLAVLGVCAYGCAHASAPTEQLASSEAAVRGAQEAGAENVPEAKLQVELAREEIAQAKKLSRDGNQQEAADRALRAGNDAELAVALARAAESQKKLQQLAQAQQNAGGRAVPMNGETQPVLNNNPPASTR